MTVFVVLSSFSHGGWCLINYIAFFSLFLFILNLWQSLCYSDCFQHVWVKCAVHKNKSCPHSSVSQSCAPPPPPPPSLLSQPVITDSPRWPRARVMNEKWHIHCFYYPPVTSCSLVESVVRFTRQHLILTDVTCYTVWIIYVRTVKLVY